MPPTLGNGKICYLDIPATDIERSAEFYERVSAGPPGGAATARWPSTTPSVRSAAPGSWAARLPVGLLVYSGDSAVEAVAAVAAHGGEIVQEIGGDAPEITARFRDPAGNVLGIYQEPEK